MVWCWGGGARGGGAGVVGGGRGGRRGRGGGARPGGGGGGRAVGVAMDRSVELVVAWWAVVKAGGVYVPVDRAHPVERIATVLDAVTAVCVLTGGADAVAGAGARPVLRIDGLDVSGRSAAAITDADRLGGRGGEHA